MAENLAPIDVDAEQFDEAYGSSNDPAKQRHSGLTRLYTGLAPLTLSVSVKIGISPVVLFLPSLFSLSLFEDLALG